MTARDDVLNRIAQAHAAAPPDDLAYGQITRDYTTTSELDDHELTERLVDRLIDYKALVRRCRTDDLAATVAAALTERGAGTVVAPAGLDETWLAQVSSTVRIDGTGTGDQLTVAELDALDGVVTSCATAIAETGTLILDGSAGMGRRVVTLIPDYHLCIVLPGQICADIPQALARLQPTRPITMISGPSATSDIELNRVEGVHGPRTLEVIIVAEGTMS
jgi:L-lactate dehydrogenase complex protein LldG